MHYIKGLGEYHMEESTVVTLGKFDGLHKGHQKLINEMIAIADRRHLKSVVFVFDMRLLYQRSHIIHRQIITSEEREHLLKGRVDCILECPFTEELQNMEAEEFIQKVLIGMLRAKNLVVGDDFRFGYGRKGDIQLLKEYEKKGLFDVMVIPKEKYEGRNISSTYIKEILPWGNIEKVNRLLGYCYIVSGKVRRGNQIGQTIQVPTLNLKVEPDKRLPENGVYFCKTRVAEMWYEGICNIGVKPTVADTQEVSIEVHLFDYEQESYGERIEVRLYHKERNEQKFKDISALKIQLQKDIEQGKKYFAAY